MRVHDARLVPVAAATWAAAGACTALPDAAAPLTAALWVATVLAVAAVAAGRRRWAVLGSTGAVLLVVSVACAAAAAGSVAAALPQREAAVALQAGGGRAVSVQVTVTGKAAASALGGYAFDAHAHTVIIGHTRHLVDVPVRVRAGTPATSSADAWPDVGARVTVAGTVRPALPGRRAVLQVQAQDDVRVDHAPSGVLAVAAHLRGGLGHAVRGLPDPAAGLVAGLAVGDTSAVSAQLDADMKSSSLSHLTAVSGANCAMVVGLAFGAAALCGARRRTRVGAGLVALAGFAVLVTPEPSVVRAAVMAAVAMIAILLGRARAGVALLCLAVVVSLVADPWLASSLGFALSCAATAALLTLSMPLTAGLARVMPRPLALAVAVPLAAQLACGPLLIVVNPTVPLYGVIANLLAAPAAPLGTILGLAACVAVPVAPLAWGLAALAWLPAAWIAGVARTAATAPGAALPWPAGAVGIVTLCVVSAALVAVIVPPGMRRGRRALRLGAAGVLVLLVGTAAGSVAVDRIVAPATAPQQWSILACDIGQGDAVLLRSAGATALVDTGPDPAPLRACLRRFGVDRIDLLVLTHYDADHIGGLDAVAERAEVVVHGPPGDASDRRTLQRLKSAGARLVSGHSGMGGRLGQATWTVLWPRADSHAFPTGNQASVVLDVRGGGIPPTLMLGDMDATAQKALVGTGALHPPYTVVKVAHHGSADQDPELYKSLHATIALISVGAGNDYGHPRPQTLAFLQADGDIIARTDRGGAAAVLTTGDTLRLWRDRTESAGAEAR